MSKQHKRKVLKEITYILQHRCKRNSEFFLMLMREKHKLQRSLPADRRSWNHQQNENLNQEISLNKQANHSSAVRKHDEKQTEARDQRHRRKSERAYRNARKHEPDEEENRFDLARRKDITEPKLSALAKNDQRLVKNAKTSEINSFKSVNNGKIERSYEHKTFTKEEIEQMSGHHKKRRPIYMGPPTHTLSNLEKIAAESRRVKTSMSMDQCRLNPEKDTPKLNAPTENKSSNLLKSQKKNGIKATSTVNSVLSPSLLKLQELKKQDDKRSTKTKTHERKPNKQSEPKRIMYKQKSLPANITSDMKHASETSNTRNNDDITLQDGTKLLKGEVVFTMDMDDAKSSQKTNQTFFRRKIFRRKTVKPLTISTQTTTETESKTTQSHSHTVPGLQSNKQSQTVTTTCKSSATQTNQDSIQSVGTQCSPAKKDSSTQTSESRGGRPRVSLDDLVQKRKQRRARSVTNRKRPDEQLSGQLKRSATLEVKSRDKTSEGDKKINKTIKSYSWSQTEKFVKVIVSHSGVHLLSINKVIVKSNGLNLKLLIDEDESQIKENVYNNNNNNSNIFERPVSYSLNVIRLCHPVVHLSYTIQPDMVTILLRKKTEKHWNDLETEKTDNLIITAAQVYL